MFNSSNPLNRKIAILLLIIIFPLSFVSIAIMQTHLEEKKQVENYRNALFSFQHEEIEDVLIGSRNKKNIILFLGRESCPYCVEFLPQFVCILQNIDTTYIKNFEYVYVDSTDSDNNLFLNAFRNKYLIDSVPAVLIISSGECKKLDLPLKDNYFDYQIIEQNLNKYLDNLKEE